jgi:hypothetical protein
MKKTASETEMRPFLLPQWSSLLPELVRLPHAYTHELRNELLKSSEPA